MAIIRIGMHKISEYCFVVVDAGAKVINGNSLVAFCVNLVIPTNFFIFFLSTNTKFMNNLQFGE